MVKEQEAYLAIVALGLVVLFLAFGSLTYILGCAIPNKDIERSITGYVEDLDYVSSMTIVITFFDGCGGTRIPFWLTGTRAYIPRGQIVTIYYYRGYFGHFNHFSRVVIHSAA